jgi:BA14K-like protein
LRGTRHTARALRLDTATLTADVTMQFLVYLTVLMISISTVLLEVHWLTTPAPQPRPAAQAASAPAQPRNVEGPTAALSPVYPKPADTTPATASGAPQSPPPNVQISPDTASADTAPQKPETTGVAVRADEPGDSAAASVASTPAAIPSNRCDVQACASAYQSFRASDCSYQPFEGPRRLCEKSPAQHTARGQDERPERRQWNRNIMPRDGDRSIERRVRDDRDESDDDDEPDRFRVFRARAPRW